MNAYSQNRAASKSYEHSSSYRYKKTKSKKSTGIQNLGTAINELEKDINKTITKTRKSLVQNVGTFLRDVFTANAIAKHKF